MSDRASPKTRFACLVPAISLGTRSLARFALHTAPPRRRCRRVRINSSSLARLKTASSHLLSSAGRAGSTVSAKSASRRCELVTNLICCEPRKQEVAVAELLDHGAAHRIIALRRPAAGRVGQAPAVGPSHDVTPQASVWLLSRHIVCLFSCLHD